MLFILQITSLADITRRNCGCVIGPSGPAPFASGTAASFQRCCSLMISGNRMEKHSLTCQPESFAVRHRLLQNSLASPIHIGPFMVELFTADRLNRSPSRSDSVSTVTSRKLPTPAVLNELDRLSDQAHNPTDGITPVESTSLTRFET